MNETMIGALMFVLVGAAGFCLGHLIATSPLQKLVERQRASEVASAKLFAMLTADVCDLKRRMDAIDGKGETTSSRPAPPPPPPRPTDSLRRQPDVANDGEKVPKVEGR